MATPRHIGGVPLHVGGAPALSDDCCCAPSCIPDPCIIPTATNCARCYDPDCNDGECLEWQSIAIAIDGVGDVATIPSWIPAGSCRTGFDCQCDVFNSVFLHSYASGCGTRWIVREASPPFALFDTCGTPQTSACNSWQIQREVYVRTAIASGQVDYTTGVAADVTFPNAYTVSNSGAANELFVCNDYSILPGHYVIIELLMSGRLGGVVGGTLYVNRKIFLYSFGNGVKVDPDCDDNQYYAGCGPYIGGDATLVVSSRYTKSGPTASPVYVADCGDVPELCALSTAVVTVDAPTVLDCPETPPPPPPP